METRVSRRLEHGGSFVLLENDGDHGAQIVPQDLSRPVPCLTIW